eukprot:NODE_579_length_5813_cov_0.453448.p1 type:complete len:426 gc:universal NODE_579_length_5813_cov_0.453448:2936-4213(+)
MISFDRKSALEKLNYQSETHSDNHFKPFDISILLERLYDSKPSFYQEYYYKLPNDRRQIGYLKEMASLLMLKVSDTSKTSMKYKCRGYKYCETCNIFVKDSKKSCKQHDSRKTKCPAKYYELLSETVGVIWYIPHNHLSTTLKLKSIILNKPEIVTVVDDILTKCLLDLVSKDASRKFNHLEHCLFQFKPSFQLETHINSFFTVSINEKRTSKFDEKLLKSNLLNELEEHTWDTSYMANQIEDEFINPKSTIFLDYYGTLFDHYSNVLKGSDVKIVSDYSRGKQYHKLVFTKQIDSGKEINGMKGVMVQLDGYTEEKQRARGMDFSYIDIDMENEKVLTHLLVGPCRFTNHCCNENHCNVEFESYYHLRRNRRNDPLKVPIFKTTKSVNEGDEVFYYYGDEPFESHNCSCGFCSSPKRRKLNQEK